MKKYSAVATLIVLMSCNGCGAPKAEKVDSPLTQKIEAEPAAPVEKGKENAESKPVKPTFDHSAFNTLLAAHVNFDAGRVDYAGLKKDEPALDAYLAEIAKVDMETYDRNEKMAILINAYNGYTLKLILENYPGVKSIRDLKEPWKTVRYNVGGEKVSLDNIEHNILRPIFKDPRIHFAVNCASVGCPALAEFAYTGDDLEAQLEKAMKRTVASDRYVQVKSDKLYVSSILKWYGEDFTKADWKPRADTIPAFLASYGEGDVGKFLKENPDAKLNFLDYSWALNDIEK